MTDVKDGDWDFGFNLSFEIGILSLRTSVSGALAHLVEHLPFKQVVPGSNPGRLSFYSSSWGFDRDQAK